MILSKPQSILTHTQKHIPQKNMKKIPLALAIATITAGSAHAVTVTYSTEDFEGGTVNYDIAGNVDGGALTQRTEADTTTITSQEAVAGTNYNTGSPTRSGIWANNNLPNTVANEPTGQHAFVASSSNRNLTLNTSLTLLGDNVETLNISLKSMLYANGQVMTHYALVYYSANGFDAGFPSDAVLIASYATADVVEPATALPSSILGNTTVVEDEWSSLSFSVSSSDVTFTDTAKIRFNKWSPSMEQQMIFLDDIVVSGTTAVPEPTSAVLFGLSGLALLLRRRK